MMILAYHFGVSHPGTIRRLPVLVASRSLEGIEVIPYFLGKPFS